MTERTYKRFVVFLCLCLCVFASCNKEQQESVVAANEKPAVDTTAVLYSNISECARLATAEYRIHKIVTFDDKIVVRGKMFSRPFSKALPVGDRKIAIPLDVTLRGYVDFSDFNKSNIKRKDGKIIITLPDPKIMVGDSKIDHRNVKKLVDPLRSNFKQEEIEAYCRQGMDSIAMAIPQLGIVEAARVNAAQVLVPIIKAMGYSETDITIQFRPTVNDRTILHWAGIEFRRYKKTGRTRQTAQQVEHVDQHACFLVWQIHGVCCALSLFASYCRHSCCCGFLCKSFSFHVRS